MEKRGFASTVVLILFLAILFSQINQPTITAKVVGMNFGSAEGNNDSCNENVDCCPEGNCGNLCDGLWECIDGGCVQNSISCGPGYVCEINQCVCLGDCYGDSGNGGPGDLGDGEGGFSDGSDDNLGDNQDTTNEDQDNVGDEDEKDDEKRIYYDGDYPLDNLKDSKENQQNGETSIAKKQEKNYIRPAPPTFLGKFCPDRDGDGFPIKSITCKSKPFDCDDDNLNVYPGALEICDGLDSDCDGNIEDDYKGEGCIPDFTTAHLPPIKESRWFRFLQIIKDVFKNPAVPLIHDIIWDKSTGEIGIIGEGFYTKDMGKGINTILVIGTIEENIYRNAYIYSPNYADKKYMGIFFQEFPEDQYLWIQTINVIERTSDYTPGNIYRIKI
jgi:hypothetical protein